MNRSRLIIIGAIFIGVTLGIGGYTVVYATGCQEAVRVLALSLDETRRGQASLTGGRATPGAQTQVAPSPQTVSPGTAPGAPKGGSGPK